MAESRGGLEVCRDVSQASFLLPEMWHNGGGDARPIVEEVTMFGHWAQILVLLVIGLLVFGPKRVIEMGSSFGKAFREFRQATRGLSWSDLAEGNDEPRRSAALSARDTSVAKLSQFTAANASLETAQTTADE